MLRFCHCLHEKADFTGAVVNRRSCTRIAVKVIDPHGNELMKVEKLG